MTYEKSVLWHIAVKGGDKKAEEKWLFFIPEGLMLIREP